MLFLDDVQYFWCVQQAKHWFLVKLPVCLLPGRCGLLKKQRFIDFSIILHHFMEIYNSIAN